MGFRTHTTKLLVYDSNFLHNGFSHHTTKLLVYDETVESLHNGFSHPYDETVESLHNGFSHHTTKQFIIILKNFK